MTTYPRIVPKDPQGRPCFVAEGKVLGTYFQIGVTSNAAAAAPMRHETIKESLLTQAGSIMEEAERAGSYDWAAHGFEYCNLVRDESGHPDCWVRNYTILDIGDLI
jgi:hypothetical protein